MLLTDVYPDTSKLRVEHIDETGIMIRTIKKVVVEEFNYPSNDGPVKGAVIILEPSGTLPTRWILTAAGGRDLAAAIGTFELTSWAGKELEIFITQTRGKGGVEVDVLRARLAGA
jgi:hypothetical protein